MDERAIITRFAGLRGIATCRLVNEATAAQALAAYFGKSRTTLVDTCIDRQLSLAVKAEKL